MPHTLNDRNRFSKNINYYRDIDITRDIEDYDLWFRLYAAGYRVNNLSEALYQMTVGMAKAVEHLNIDKMKRELFIIYLNTVK